MISHAKCSLLLQRLLSLSDQPDLLTNSSPDLPELSVSYITLTGFAHYGLEGKDGSLTQILSYSEPETKPVGPPQVQVGGQCYPYRAAGPPPLELSKMDL